MSTFTGSCVVCNAPGTLRCSACHLATYCGRNHQESDWSQHKYQCSACEIRVSEAFGRHLVATKDLKQDDLILIENPSVVGPTDMSSYLSCVGCYCALKQLKYTCPRCQLPACKKNCLGLQDPAGHALECAFFKTGEISPIYLAWPGTAVLLRCLLLRKANPEMWQTIQEKAPYAAAKRVKKISGKMEVMLQLMEPMLQKFASTAPDLLPDVSKATLTKIIDVIDAHAFDICINGDDGIVALYPVASLLQTSCAPNTRLSFFVDPKSAGSTRNGRMGQVTVKAATDIAKGDILMWTVIPTTMSTVARQGFLFNYRNMRCYCTRCLDPTELGSNFGTIICTTCCGWILPVHSFNIVTSPWKCYGTCGAVLSRDEAANRQVVLQNILSFLIENKAHLLEFEKLLKTFEANFHRNSWSCMNLKRVMMKIYSISPDLFKNRKHFTATLDSYGIGRNPPDCIPDSQLLRKAELCRDILDILSQVYAGVHPVDVSFTADILLNFASAELEILKRNFGSENMDQAAAVNTILACHAILTCAEDFVKTLCIKDWPKRRLGTLVEDIQKEIARLRNWGVVKGLIIQVVEQPPENIPKLT